MKLQKKYLIIAMAAAMGVSGGALAAQANSQLHFGAEQKMSNDQVPDLGMAFKTKLVRLGNGALITVFGDGVDSSNVVYDLKKDKERAARDIFIRTCDSFNKDCGVEDNWSSPENVSNTAGLSSFTADWQGDNGTPSAYYGDSDKPNISNGGSNIMITWTDKYCPGGNQRSVSYVTRENREIPFSCTYSRFATVAGDGTVTWGGADTDPAVAGNDKVQLSDGSRDAKQDVSKVNSMGRAAITWQEDPQGLQIGSADGPGDGASGAIASHGTDIWLVTSATTIPKVVDGVTVSGKVGSLSAVARLTDNTTGTLAGDNRVVRDGSGALVDKTQIDGGQTGATRANTAIVGPKIVVAYEETKGSEEIEFGKYVRYHNFAYTNDPSTVAGQAGCIISNPTENARRVRFVPQATPGTVSGIQMGIFWKEGKYDQGGPSDIMARVLRNGVDQANMLPAVDTANCVTSLYSESSVLVNDQALNLSSNTKTGGNLADTTEANNIENALAHRGAIIGDDLYIGYTYTSDWALATYTTLENHDFWLRHYDGVTDTWAAPQNLSNLPTLSMNVREPRFVKTPYTEDPAQNYNPSAFVVAWGTQSNVASHIEDPEDLDIYYTRTFDKGTTFEPIVKVDNPNGVARFESQLRPTPDGQTLYAVWNEDNGTTVEAVSAKALTGDVIGEDPYEPPADTTVVTTGGGSAGVFDGMILPALVGLFMGMIGFLGLRKIQK